MGKWDGKEIKLIMPLICIRLWKVLGKENWGIIYVLSEMGCQPELAWRLVGRIELFFWFCYSKDKIKEKIEKQFDDMLKKM